MREDFFEIMPFLEREGYVYSTYFNCFIKNGSGKKINTETCLPKDFEWYSWISYCRSIGNFSIEEFLVHESSSTGLLSEHVIVER